MMNHEIGEPSPHFSPPPQVNGSAPPDFDFEDYRDELKDFDLTDEQAEEILHTLWNMMSAMVDLGWGVDTVQIVLPELFVKACNSESDSLYKH